MAQAVQGKAPCVRLWRKRCNGICWTRVQFIAYWHWRHYITMLMLHRKMRWCRWHLEVILEGEDVSGEIRTQEVANAASQVAAFPRVREALLRRQRAFRELPGLIADGRDMGTVVFPDAPVKIFLDASSEERAHRRMLQLQEKGFSVNFERLLAEIKERDDRDRNRAVAPLVPAADALVLDSTTLSIEQVIEKALQYARQKLALA